MQPRVKESIIQFLNKERPGKLLDVPSGTGWLSQELCDPGWEYHGSDLFTSPHIKNFTSSDLNDPLPYEDASFDYITCAEGLEHIENYHHVLREFSRLLKPGGKVIVSTPNPLNIKSRRRYYREGTFNGFPHLIEMPKEGEHLHMSPINLSFLINFAERYGLTLNRVHPIEIRNSYYRYIPQVLWIKLCAQIRNLSKDQKTRHFMQQLTSCNVLLNDGMVVSFTK